MTLHDFTWLYMFNEAFDPQAYNILLAYWAVYVFLLCALAVLFLSFKTATFKLFNWRLLTTNLRLIFLCLCAAFAGLPPFGFFFFKLSVLSLVTQNGALLWSIGLLLLIFMGWYTYWYAARNASHLVQAWHKSLNVESLSLLSWAYALILGFLVCSLFFITDFGIFFSWTQL